MAIYWSGYLSEYFTRNDLEVLRNFSIYVGQTKKQIKQETEAEKLKRNIPTGLPNLTGKYERALGQVWDERVLENNVTLNEDLQNVLTEEEALNMALSEEVNTMFANRMLNTETLQQMLHPRGYLTEEGAKYFCLLLEENFPDSKFIFLNQSLSKQEARMLHATHSAEKYSAVKQALLLFYLKKGPYYF